MAESVFILGASGDIGSAIAINLGLGGYNLILHYNKNRNRVNEIKKHLPNDVILSELQADLSQDDEVKRLITEVVFHVDHIIFASGNASYGLLQETSEKQIDDMLSIHVKAPLLISKYLLPMMIQQRFGNIIFISSIWGDVGASNEVIYSTVKGAQNSFVKSLAKEVGRSGITVNAVSPGFINTKMNAQLTWEEHKQIIEEIPLNRAGKPEEVAHLVRFLLDEKSNYIHGEIIGLNGGW